jgi:radical SAM superfamily enzyme YgiQ (UPF0313 family)
MGKVVLIQAAVHDEHVECSQPLGLMYLASYLRAHSPHEPVIYDMRPAYRRLDLVRDVLLRHRPDVVAISAQSPEAPVMHRVAEMVKEFNPETPVVVGGVHATAYAAETMRGDPAIDFVIPGEGEITFCALTRALLEGGDPTSVDGIVHRAGGEPTWTPARPVAGDPDTIPYPAWDLIDLDVYGRLPRIGMIYAHPRYMMMETARACPFDCAWCHKTAGRQHRMHSAEYVVGEFEELVGRHGVGEVTIIDDMFNFSIDRVNAIFEGLLRQGIRVPIAVVNGLRADLLPDETLALMRRAGVYRVMFAIETATPRLQKLMRKNLGLDKARHAIDTAHRLGFLIHGNFIIGLPDETEAEVTATVDFAVQSKMDTIGLYRATPYKNCDLYEIALAQGIDLPSGEHIFSFWESDINLSRAPLAFLKHAKKSAYWRTYLHPRRLFHLLWKLPNKRKMVPFLFLFFLRKAFRDN